MTKKQNTTTLENTNIDDLQHVPIGKSHEGRSFVILSEFSVFSGLSGLSGGLEISRFMTMRTGMAIGFGFVLVAFQVQKVFELKEEFELFKSH